MSAFRDNLPHSYWLTLPLAAFLLIAVVPFLRWSKRKNFNLTVKIVVSFLFTLLGGMTTFSGIYLMVLFARGYSTVQVFDYAMSASLGATGGLMVLLLGAIVHGRPPLLILTALTCATASGTGLAELQLLQYRAQPWQNAYAGVWLIAAGALVATLVHAGIALARRREQKRLQAD